jgi:energy-converting hydrogenase A subunit M
MLKKELERLVEQLEIDKKDLQEKLIDARSCAKCYICTDNTCKNRTGNNLKNI